MPTVDNHIASLLQDHDCVIIPGFGGLITQYTPVRIHPVRSSMAPPSKKVAFNEKLQLNDGRLVNYISVQEHLSQTDAATRVQAFVATVNMALDQQQRYLLQDIGLFRKENGGVVEFDYEAKINLLAESFGLPEVFSKPVVRTRSLSEIRTAVQEKVAIPLQAEMDGQKHTSIWKKALRYAALLPIIMLSASAIYLATTLDNGFTLSNLNPVSLIMNLKPEIPASVAEILNPVEEEVAAEVTEPATDKVEPVSEITAEPVKTEETALTPLTDEERDRLFYSLMPAKLQSSAYLTDQYLSQEILEAKAEQPEVIAEANTATEENSISDNWDTPAEAISVPAKAEAAKAVVREETKKPVALRTSSTDKAEVFVESKSGKFYIIVGGFASVENATKLQKKITADGLESKIIAPDPDSRLNRVSIGVYDSQQQASEMLPELTGSYGRALWILEY